LIAEDDPLVRRLCMRTLERAGYQVLEAANGAEAIRLARTNDAIDLALLDVVMPEVTGPQAYAVIREIHPDLPVLFSSGYADVSKLSHAVPEDARLLAKPLRMPDLLSAVRDILDRRASSR
jgi:CheY-like chemotaxis protein